MEDLEMSLLIFNFVIIYIIHKILVLLKNYPNFLRDSFFQCFFKEYNIPLLKKIIIFFTVYNDAKFKSWRIKHNQKYKKSF